MSAIDLFLLGCLAERSISAYDLANFILGNHIDEMVKISTPAVYKNLIKLGEKGFLEVQGSKAGKMPEKKIYSITGKGREELKSLLEKEAAKDLAFSMDFNCFILNLSKVTKAEAFKLLEEFKLGLSEKRRFMAEMTEFYSNVPFEGRAIMRQYRMVLDTLSRWLEGFMAEYANERP
jgi:DNA-binding PadR family transcriptional regulator